MSKRYNDESLARALEAHRVGGWIERWEKHGPGSTTTRPWQVWVSGVQVETMNSAEVHAFVIGLRTAQIVAERRATALVTPARALVEEWREQMQPGDVFAPEGYEQLIDQLDAVLAKAARA